MKNGATMADPFEYWKMGIKKTTEDKIYGLIYSLPEQDGDEIYQRNKDMELEITIEEEVKTSW